MAGVVGLVVEPGSPDVEGTFSRLLNPMNRGGGRVSEAQVNASRGWALGRVHLNILQPGSQLTGEGTTKTLFHGDLFNQSELATLVADDAAPHPTTAAATVSALYQRFGAGFAARLKGSFCAVVLDDEAKQLLLVTDRLGSYPLYWCKSPDGFAFASELRAIVKTAARPALNLRTINDLLHFGLPLGDKTIVEGVQLLPSASTLTYQWATGAVAIERYASWAPAFRPSGIDKPRYLDAVAGAFATSMERSVSGPHRYGLSLSGGLDTRVMLSALDRLRVPLSTFTGGEKGCADEIIGYQLAKMSHSRHRFVPLGEQYLAEFLPVIAKMVSLTDGTYMSHGFTEVLALQAFAESDATVLLRGHLGELAKASTAWPFHTDAEIFGMQSKEQLAPHLMKRFESLNHGQASQGLFTDACAEASDERVAQQSLEESLDVDLSPPDLCSYIYMHEFHPRVTIPSLEIFRDAGEVRLPLADVDFIECVLQAPPAWRDGVEIHQALIARNNPAYLKVRNTNTGAPAGAGPLREFVLDKLNSVAKRLNLYGYRHYHNFNGWMRQSVLNLAQQMVLGPDTLGRGMVREPALQALVSRAKAGDPAPDHVLQVLALVEFWQRENL